MVATITIDLDVPDEIINEIRAQELLAVDYGWDGVNPANPIDFLKEVFRNMIKDIAKETYMRVKSREAALKAKQDFEKPFENIV